MVLQEPSSVKDIVQQWQEQGGGVIEIPTVEAIDPPRSPHAQIEKPFRTSPKKDDPHNRFSTPESEAKTPQKHSAERMRAHLVETDRRPRSAPSKRVVSDGHWRRKSGKIKDEPMFQSAGRRDAGRNNTAQTDSVHDKVNAASPIRAVLHSEERQRRRARLNSSRTREAGTSRDHPGDLAAAHSGGNSIASPKAPESVQEQTLHLGKERNESRNVGSKVRPVQPKTLPVHGSQFQVLSREGDDVPNEELLSEATKVDYSVDRFRFSRRKGRGSVRSDKANMVNHVLTESKKLFTRPTSELQFSQSTPSIEAWLDGTADPFIDDGCATTDRNIEPLPERGVTSQGFRETRGNDHAEVEHATESGKHSGSQRMTPQIKAQTGNARDGISQALPFSTFTDRQPQAQTEPEDDQLTVPAPLLKRRTAHRSTSSPVQRRRRREKKPNVDPTDHADETVVDVTVAAGSNSRQDSTIDSGGHIAVNDPQPSTRSVAKSPNDGHGRPKQISAPNLDREEHQSRSLHEDLRRRPTVPKSSTHSRPTRLTKHADLMSVLSLSANDTKIVQPARSIRKTSGASQDADPELLMQDLLGEETKYMQELRTLVDGVIPVLLSCVLSKADLNSAAGLFNATEPTASHADFTRPIIDMGVALERLRSLHKRIPQTNHLGFLTWAHGAQRVYADYLKAWRMGFKDVIINLASAEAPSKAEGDQNHDQAATRDDSGDLVHEDGEKVDVAFLLKRPLVRLKHLARTIKFINTCSPSAESAGLANSFATLVEQARCRVEEERARLEDEAAANIDVTRARHLRTLAPLTGVQLEQSHHVRARDFFNLTLRHTNGQNVDCRVELIWRENAQEGQNQGDCLFCEVDGTGRWLLFPPFSSDMISARRGTSTREIVTLIRCTEDDGSKSQEIVTLESEDEKIALDWLHMFAAEPVPPKLQGKDSSGCLVDDAETEMLSVVGSLSKTRSPIPNTSAQLTAQSQPDLPMGEKVHRDSLMSSPSGKGSRDSHPRRSNPRHRISQSDLEVRDAQGEEKPSSFRNFDSSRPLSRGPRSFKEALGLHGTSSMSGLRRAKANRRSQSDNTTPARLTRPRSASDRGYRKLAGLVSEANTQHIREHRSNETQKLGGKGQPQSPHDAKPEEETEEQRLMPLEYEKTLSIHRESSECKQFAGETPESKTSDNFEGFDPAIESTWVRRPQSKGQETDQQPRNDGRQIWQGSSLSAKLISGSNAKHPVSSLAWTPGLDEIAASRYLSPLKHQYEPSTASESDSESNLSEIGEQEGSSVTESTDGDDEEKADVPAPLMILDSRRLPLRNLARGTIPHHEETTLQPSDSASQAPYKTVPIQRQEANKTVASILAWTDKGAWEPIHPDECSIVISPGLIEAFEMSAAHSSFPSPSKFASLSGRLELHGTESSVSGQNDEVQGERPLVALELTPLVPLRKGTAIDISIRSPPTSNSQITSGNNILFRSRSPEECEALYVLINHARIHNPTYIALQNARGPFGIGAGFSAEGTRASDMRPGSARHSWFGGLGRSASYRARSKRASSVSPSDSSVGTMSSAFSALRRFGRGNRGKFNIALSTITSRNGGESGSASVYSTSDNASGSGAGAPLAGMTANRDGSLGLTDAKIRIYSRETSSKWRDMGSARLTILQPERDASGAPPSSSLGPQAVHSKRILVHGKTKGEVLLDAQLGESCFERVARTGIAVSVWEDVIGPNGEIGVAGAIGGVVGGTTKVYMIQMKSEAETAYTFSLVGKLRY